MAISVGTYTTVRSNSTPGVSGAQSDTYNMPSSGTDRGLVIIIVVQANGAPSTVSAVSYGSSGTLTEVVTTQNSRTRSYIYCVEDPDTGSNTLAFTLDNNTNRSHSVHAVPLTGVHQTDMSGVTDTLGYNNSTTMNKSVTTGTANSELVGMCEANYDGSSMNPFSESASNTMLAESGTGTQTNFDHEWWVGHRSTTTATGYTFGGTGNSLSSGSLIVVEVLEAASGAPNIEPTQASLTLASGTLAVRLELRVDPTQADLVLASGALTADVVTPGTIEPSVAELVLGSGALAVTMRMAREVSVGTMLLDSGSIDVFVGVPAPPAPAPTPTAPGGAGGGSVRPEPEPRRRAKPGRTTPKGRGIEWVEDSPPPMPSAPGADAAALAQAATQLRIEALRDLLEDQMLAANEAQRMQLEASLMDAEAELTQMQARAEEDAMLLLLTVID